MSYPGDYRREIVIVGVGVVIIAVLSRYAWLPVNPELALENAAAKWQIQVEGVGRWFSAWALGDGQAFAVIAADPLGLDEGWELKSPFYRYARPGFGWLASVFSLGQEQWIPYAMAFVGVLAVTGTFVLAARLRPHLGPSAWLLILNPAVFLAFAGDTAEGLGILALTWAMITGSRWASVTLAVIRPTFAVALFGRWKPFLAALGTTTLVGLLWIIRFGFEFNSYRGNFDFPFVGYLTAPSIQATGLATLALLTLVWGWRHRNWAWMASGIFVLCFSEWVVALPGNGWRVAGFLFVLWAFGPDYSPPEARASSRSEPALTRA